MSQTFTKQVKWLGLATLLVCAVWGCGTTRSVANMGPSATTAYIDNAKVTFVDNVSPAQDVIQTTTSNVVEAGSIIKVYDYNDHYLTQVTATGSGTFSINFGDNVVVTGNLVYLTATAPVFSIKAL
jgi:hypothetical protein